MVFQLTKNNLIKIYNDNFYNLFNLIPETTLDIVYSKPVYNINSIKKPKIITRKNNNNYRVSYDEFITLQLAGNYNMHNEIIVPVSFYTLEHSIKSCITKQIHYRAYSIDDSSQSFWLYTLENTTLLDGYKLIFQYLEEHSLLETNKEFMDWFNKKCKNNFKIEYDFN